MTNQSLRKFLKYVYHSRTVEEGEIARLIRKTLG